MATIDFSFSAAESGRAATRLRRTMVFMGLTRTSDREGRTTLKKIRRDTREKFMPSQTFPT
jgi:hypothetical protein